MAPVAAASFFCSAATSAATASSGEWNVACGAAADARSAPGSPIAAASTTIRASRVTLSPPMKAPVESTATPTKSAWRLLRVKAAELAALRATLPEGRRAIALCHAAERALVGPLQLARLPDMRPFALRPRREARAGWALHVGPRPLPALPGQLRSLAGGAGATARVEVRPVRRVRRGRVRANRMVHQIARHLDVLPPDRVGGQAGIAHRPSHRAGGRALQVRPASARAVPGRAPGVRDGALAVDVDVVPAVDVDVHVAPVPVRARPAPEPGGDRHAGTEGQLSEQSRPRDIARR